MDGDCLTFSNVTAYFFQNLAFLSQKSFSQLMEFMKCLATKTVRGEALLHLFVC